MEDYKLIIFDLDDSLVKAFTSDPLPGRREWFDANQDGGYKYALATNQGGVGLRRRMEIEEWGDPKQYPTERQVTDRINDSLAALGVDMPAYMCYAYLSKKGLWYTCHNAQPDSPWAKEWRKPNPGMLLQAMKDAGVTPAETLFVGNGPEDYQAAQAAGVQFCLADEFFAEDDNDN